MHANAAQALIRNGTCVQVHMGRGAAPLGLSLQLRLSCVLNSTMSSARMMLDTATGKPAESEPFSSEGAWRRHSGRGDREHAIS